MVLRPSLVVSNVPSNITMTVIAALINAGPTANRRPVTPPGFNAILSGVADRSRSLRGALHVPVCLLRGDDTSYRFAQCSLCARVRRE